MPFTKQIYLYLCSPVYHPLRMLPTVTYTAPALHILTIRSERGYADSSLNVELPSEAENQPQGNENSVYEHESWEW